MARLIDADDLVEKFWKPECRTQTRRDFVAMVDYAPTVDAQPVVHGRWIHDEAYIRSRKVKYVCSVCCHYSISRVSDKSMDAFSMRYCPNCGAKMDGGNDEKQE